MARDFQFAAAGRRAAWFATAWVSLLLAGCGLLLTPHYRLERARREIKAGQWQEAAVDLRIVVQKEPRNTKAWLMLARLSLDAGDLGGARSDLARTVALGAKGTQVEALRARIWIAGGEPARLLDAIAQHRIALAEPEQTLMTARALLALRQPAAALAKLQPLLAAQPGLTQARDMVAEALASESQYAPALQQLAVAMRHDAKSSQPPLLEGLILQQEGQYAAAQGALELALRRMLPDEPVLHRARALIALTEVRLGLGDLEGAAGSEAALAKLEPQSPATALLNARLKIAHKNLQGGVAELEQIVQEAPGFVEARLLLGATLLQRGDLEQAQQQLQQVIESVPDNLAARELLAQVQLKLGQPQAALGVLNPALATDALDPRLLSLYGAAANRAGDEQGLIEALRQSQRAHPNDQTVLLNLGAAYLAAGQAEQALQVLQKTTDDGDLRRDRLLIASMAATRGAAAAGAEVQSLLTAHPRDPGVLDLAAAYYVAQGRAEDARAALRESLALDPGNAGVVIELARLDEAGGDLGAAESRLQGTLKAHPQALPVRLALAGVLVRMKSYDSARALLEASGPQAGPEVKFALAEVALASGNLQAANTALDQALAERPGQAAPVEDAGLLLMKANQNEAALARFAQATKLAPRNAGYWVNTARAQLALNQPAAARASLNEAGQLHPDWLPVVSMLAYIDVRQGSGQAALARVHALLAQRPKDPAVLTLEGDVERNLNQPAAAAAAYTRAQELAPTAQLAADLYRVRLMAHTPEPQRPLEKWLARAPQSGPIRDMLGEYYLGAGKSPRQAVQQFKAVIAQDPNDVVALNDLAWALNQIGDPAAVGYAGRAYRLAPGVPSVDDTLGWVLVHNGEAAAAVDHLREAVKLDPGNLDVQYHLAYALAKAGHPAEARQILAKILAHGQPFASQSAARQLLTDVKS